MKIEFTIRTNTPKWGIEDWLKEINPDASKFKTKEINKVLNEYYELVEEFKTFLHNSESIVDREEQRLKPIDIYNAVDYFKIRIKKLLLMINLKLYKTHNVNKETKVRYIVMRAFWIDENGKPYRYFSKNLGAENKVLVNGKIPVKMMESVEDYIRTLMWDLYHFEYIDNSEAGVDSEGYLRIPSK
jgi:hypothetical protein